MYTHMSHEDFEKLNLVLNNTEELRRYKEKYNGYKAGTVARLFGGLLVTMGTIVYGKRPTYLKFRAIEVIARVPYQSWTSATFTLLTLCFSHASRALTLSDRSEYASYAQANETMHVVVISELAQGEERAGFFRHTLIPMLFAFFYFWFSYILYLVHPRSSYELNYLFESHAFSQYDQFLREQEETLKQKPVQSEFLSWYGRHPRNQYEFFVSVRNDELIHRNRSLEEPGINYPHNDSMQ